MLGVEKNNYGSISMALRLCLRFALLSLCSILTIDSTSASGTWEVIHHVPGADWKDVFFLDESHGWAVGDKGAIMSTDDGGRNWTLLHRNYGQDPRYESCFFVSEEEGWIVGKTSQDGVIILAENGGKRLTENAAFPRAGLYDVYFTSENEGWVVGEKDGGTLILHTEDAGEHWEVQDGGHRGVLFKVHFIDENRGFAVGLSGAMGDWVPLVLRTEDGGRTWNKQSIPIDKGGCTDIFFLNSLEGWIIMYRSLLKTTDGGNSWESIDVPPNAQLTSVWFKDSEQGILLGADRSTPIPSGMIMKTEDGGQTFDTQGGFSMLNAIACAGDDSWVVGHGNTIMHSQDDENWDSQIERAYQYVDIDFVGKDVGFLLGQSGRSFVGDTVILSTDDGGNNWQETGVHAEWLYCLDFIDDSSGWIGAANGVYRTEDAGKTIQRHEGVPGGILGISGMVFPTKKRGWLGGYNELWRTSDGGETWQEARVDLRGGYVADVAALDKSMWIVGTAAEGNGFVYMTQDDGEKFRKASVEESLYGISFVTEDAGWAVGNFGAIFITDDGGRNWEKQESGTDRELNDVLFLSEEEGWAVGEDGIVLHTDNGGNTWTAQESRSGESLYKIVYTGRDCLLAVGEWSTILKYTDGSLFQYSERFAVPDEKLQPITWGRIKSHVYQNYPNPFNPETWIPFSVAEPASISIRIHNVSGQLVREINLGHREPGSYLSKGKAAYWDGRNQAGGLVSSGIYYYSFGDSSEARKMILMK